MEKFENSLNREESGNFEINKMFFQRTPYKMTFVVEFIKKLFEPVCNSHFRRPEGVFWKIWRVEGSYGYERSEYEAVKVSSCTDI